MISTSRLASLASIVTLVMWTAFQIPSVAQIPIDPIPYGPLRQGGFEVPDLGTGMGAYAYTPSGSAWIFAGGTGLAGNGSGFTYQNPPAPQGDQVLFVQGGSGSVVSQAFSVAAGRYRLAVKAAQRIMGGSTNQQTVRIQLDGTEIATITPADGNYALFTSDSFVVSTGTHTLQIVGINPQGGDNTAFLDDLKLHAFAVIGDLWSDPATWGGTLPGPATDAVIQAGQIVVLDTLAAQVRSLTVDGELHCADKDIALKAEWIMVHGRFECGSVASPYLDDFELTLVGPDDGGDVMGMGDKVLGAMGSARVELHGEPRLSWTQLAATAAVNASTITVIDAVNWRQGDQIVIAPTHEAYDEGEVVTLQSVSPDGRTLTISPSLGHQHWGTQTTYANATTSWTLDERAEVGLLTRNITIKGDDQYSGSGFGGHMMSMAGTTVRTSGVEFYHMGQKGKLGRYPFHWHLLLDAPGQYIKNSSIHRSWNRCVTVHGTHDTLVADNVCYDFIGHGYFLEDGLEQRNVFDHNLGVWAKKPLPTEALLPTDYRDEPASNGPAVFWIGHPDNTYTRNAAAGSEGTGFWYGMGDTVTGQSFQLQLPDWDINPRTSPFGTFADNRVHSSRQGFSSCTEGGGPLGMEPPNEALITGLTVTNVGQGVWPCSPPMTQQNARFDRMIVANSINGMQAPNPMTFENSLFVSYTANAPAGAQLGAGLDWRAIQVYDQGFLLDNVHFVNYDRPAHTIFFPGSGAHKLVNNRGDGLSFANSPNVFTDAHENGQLGKGPAEWGDVVHDLDGSFVGAGSAIVNDHPLMYDASCTQPTDIRIAGYACPYRYAHFRTENFSQIAPVTILRSDGVHKTSGHIEQRFINEFVIDGTYFYTYAYTEGMKHERVQVELYNAFAGDAPVYEFLDVPSSVQILTPGWTQAPTLRALFDGPGHRWFWREGSLFLKLLASGVPWHATDLVIVCIVGNGNCDQGDPVDVGGLPSVTITSPADGARLPAGTPITVTAEANDPDGSTGQAHLYLGTVKKGTDTAAPYSFTFPSTPAGNYPLKLVVEYDPGRTYTAVQQLYVGEPGPRLEITSHVDHMTFDTAQTVNIAFNVHNWTITPGGTHLHWFINNVDQGHLYSTAPLAVSNLSQGRQEIKIALAQADETILAINDTVTFYAMENGVIADYEDGLDRRTTVEPQDGPRGTVSDISYAWGTAEPVASRADAEDDINWYDVFNNGDATILEAVYRLPLDPAQDWTAYNHLQIKAGALTYECFVIDAGDGATSLGMRTGQTTTLALPAANSKIDEVLAIELRTLESWVPGASERNHLFEVKLLP